MATQTTFRPFPTLHTMPLLVYARHLRHKLSDALSGKHGPIEPATEELFQEAVALLERLMDALAVEQRVRPPHYPVGTAEPPASRLTLRERQILKLMCAGYRNSEIARETNFALGTIKAHIRTILQKLGATDRTEAAALATRRGLI
jgi:DNA-binding NarL/FixJ family response regulator